MPATIETPVRCAEGSRRRFLAGGALTCLAFGLSQTLWANRLFADPRTAEFERWLEALRASGERLKRGEITIEQWQAETDVLYRTVSLDALRAHVDFDRLTEKFDFTGKGEAFVDLDPVTGERISPLPSDRDRFTTKLAGVRQDSSVPPHGHENMTSAFLVLHGEFHVRQYDKLQTRERSLVFRKSRDEVQKPGDWSSTSETRRNMHWLHAVSGDAYFFSTKITYIVPDAPMKGRVNVDLRNAVERGGGVVEAPIISFRRSHEIYNGAT